jgi:DNA-binding MarR family transcriptional regulator
VFDRIGVRETPVGAIVALGRIAAADGKQPVDDPHILEDFLTARLDALPARAAERTVELLDELEGDIPAGQLDRQRQAGGAGPRDQDFGFATFHRERPQYVYDTYIEEAGMASRKRVHHTRIEDLRAIYGAVVDLVGIMNRPQRDARMIDEAGISLDRALFPLLVGIGRFGPIGVVDLADRVGRDYTTVSRQVAKLESLGLVTRQAARADKRVREAAITGKGRQMTKAIDIARDRILTATLADWPAEEIATLARLMRQLADRALAAGA